MRPRVYIFWVVKNLCRFFTVPPTPIYTVEKKHTFSIYNISLILIIYMKLRGRSPSCGIYNLTTARRAVLRVELVALYLYLYLSPFIIPQFHFKIKYFIIKNRSCNFIFKPTPTSTISFSYRKSCNLPLFEDSKIFTYPYCFC